MGSQVNEGPLHPGDGWRRVQEGDSLGQRLTTCDVPRGNNWITETRFMYMGGELGWSYVHGNHQYWVIFKANGFNRIIWEGV